MRALAGGILTKEEQAAKIIDGLLVLFSLYDEDYNIIDDALHYIAETRKNNPNHPITVSLSDYMESKNLLTNHSTGTPNRGSIVNEGDGAASG